MSVIVPVRNGEETLPACLNGLASQDRRPDEIIVVDNGSTDQTVSRVKEWTLAHSDLRLHLVMETREGPSAARNRGAREARGDVLVFLDADCIPEHGWLGRMEEEFQRGSCAVGGTYWGYSPGHRMEKYVHAARISLLGKRMVLSDVHLQGAFLVGGNSAFEKTLFQEIGGYHEAFKAGEDLELSMRLIHRGVEPVYNPAIRVTHQSRTSPRARLRRSFWSGLVEVYEFQRYHPRKGLVRLFPRGRFQIPSLWRFHLDLWSPLGFLIFLGIFIFLWGRIGMVLAFSTVLFFFLRLAWVLKRGGEKVTFTELFTIAIFLILERVFLEAGRLYGTIRHRILYL